MSVAREALEIMHYDRASFEEARDDPERLSETGDPECVAGCYRCVLSYFNQPDHEQIDRRDPAALAFLLRLAHVGRAASDKGQVCAGRERTPAPDDTPLTIDGLSFSNVWRKARIVVVDQGEADKDVIAKLTAKGVRLVERPADPGQRDAFEAELNEMLKA